MNKKSKFSKETIQKFLDFQRIGNIAVQRTQQINRMMGIPNVYGRDGKIIYEMPNGEIIVKDIEKDK